MAFLPGILNWFQLAPGRYASHLACLSLGILGGAELFAQENAEPFRTEYFSRDWTVEDGLPHNIINHIVQDAQGYLWIASVGGLVRFDGRQFKPIPLDQTSGELNSNVRDLVVESSGGLLMLPASGGILELQNGRVTSHPASAAVKGKTSSNLFFEPSGVIWADAEGGELARWESGRSESFHRGREIPPMSGRFSFAVDAQRRLWMGTGDSFGYFEKGRLVWRPERIGPNIVIAPSRSGGVWISSSERLMKLQGDGLAAADTGPDWRSLTQSSTQQLYEDRQGKLWIATRRSGLLCFSGGKIDRVQAPAENVTAIVQDAEDNIWIGTHGGGISRLRPKAFVSLDEADGSSDSVRTSLCEDSAGALWVANRRSSLARCRNDQVQRYQATPGGRQAEMYLVCPDKNGLVWVSTSGGLFTISSEHPTQLEPHPSGLKDVRIFLCARNGDVWAAHGDTGIGYFHDDVYRECAEEGGPALKRIRVLAEDADGSIWIGRGDRSLSQYSGDKFVERFSSAQVPGGTLNALLINSLGDFWLATTRGLVLKRGTHFKRFGADEGLSDELVSQILEDQRGTLWWANRRGFSSVPLADLIAVADGRRTRVTEATLGKEDGLPQAFALSGIPPLPWRAHDGRLWFATNRGFVGIDPTASLPRQSSAAVYIDELEVDKKLVNLSAPPQLSGSDHQVTFRFSAINFSSPEKIHLRHQLVGYDSDWVDTDTDRRASYVHLSPGIYRMQVVAQVQGGPWSESPAELALAIAPAWYQTWLFRVAAALTTALGFGWLVRHWSQRRLRARLAELEREHQLERERSRIARDLHDEIGYSVTQIGLIADRLKRDVSTPDLTGSLGELVSCSRRLSGELDGVVWTVSPQNNRWDRLAVYLRQFALNFFADTAITCTVDGVDSAPGEPVAPEVQHHLLAIIKESLHNILKHAGATRVELSLAFTQTTLTLRLVDNGIGFNPTATEHTERNGLNNLRTRASEIGGKLSIVSSPGHGTELHLSLDLNAGRKVTVGAKS